ncbi:hypothetical protein [Moheibacter stercoris]|uniref:Uncharacterized protein n=1 Tax=Moheibacter stercoris TaxID=1628251 RepID=A0ABV2LU51_9FLAO
MKRLFLTAILGISFVAFGQDKPLSPEKVKQENRATAKEEVKVAAEKSEAEIALEQGKELNVRTASTAEIRSMSSATDAKFSPALGIEGNWELGMNPEQKEIILTGGTILNKSDVPTQKLRMMVYFADKGFSLEKPELIGNMYSFIDIDPIEAKGNKVEQSFITTWAIENMQPGTYYPYIILGEFNPQTNQFDLRDVKVFDNTITIP